jgi:hypothetical protein
MACRGAASGLMLAGLIVTLVGLSVALTRTLEIPGYWTTVGVGVALLVAGAFRASPGGVRRPDTSGS